MSGATPPIVYLDSSDYSTLSDPRRDTPEIARTREALRRFAATNQVQFVFSGVHLSEMAPLQTQFSPAATARADLLVELCGSYAFVSFDRLLKLELSSLLNRDVPPYMVLSNNAEWFPELGEILAPFQWESAAAEIDAAVKERGMNRQQRRQLGRKLFKAKAPTSELRNWLAAQDPRASLDDVVRLYPMHPDNAALLSGYVLGQVPASVAEAAFVQSLRDPRWMMRWFAAHHDKMNVVADWMRAPARSMHAGMRRVFDTLQRQEESGGERSSNKSRVTIDEWKVFADASSSRPRADSSSSSGRE
jgi:hypothetical protein